MWRSTRLSAGKCNVCMLITGVSYVETNIVDGGISLRIYPHAQDTGGFFVAVFEKVSPMTGVDNAYIAHTKGENIDTNQLLESEKKDEELLEKVAPAKEEQEEADAEATEVPSKRVAAEGEASASKRSKKVKDNEQLKEAPFELMAPDNPDILEST